MGKLFGIFLFLSGVASAAPINCNQFWAGAAGEPPFNCDLYTKTGFPKTIAGAEMRIYHYSDGWTDEVGQLELLGAVTDAIEQAAPFFGNLAAVPRMSFLLYNEFHETDYAQADWQLSTSTEPCRIRLYFNIPDDRELAHQIVAHEMFHCVQRHGIVALQTEEQDGKLYSARWWAEGSANYFSSLIFPSGNGEISHIPYYKPTLPLYHQPDPYSNALFFAGIEGVGISPEAQIGILKGQPQFSTFAAERRALSSHEALGPAFHNFARNLVMKKVTGAYGKKLPLPELPAGPAMDVDVDLDHVGLSVTPWTMNRSMLHFPPGTHKTLSLGGDVEAGKVRISRRKKGDDLYLGFEPGLEVEINVPCSDEKGQDYDFLYTSTADSAEAMQFKIDMKGEQKPCKCEESALPVDKCLLGNWKMNNPAWVSWVHSTVASQFHSVMAQGTHLFDFHKTHTARQDFQKFKTTLNIEKEGQVIPWIETTNDGTVDYKIIQREKGKMCLRQTSVTGTATFMVAGSESTSPLESAMAGLDAAADLRVLYECKAKSLVITAEENLEVKPQWVFDKVSP